MTDDRKPRSHNRPRPRPRRVHDGIRRVAAIAVLLLLATGPALAQTSAEDASALRAYFSANGMLNRGLYDLAVTEYRGFLDRYPDHEKADVARYGLGVSLFRLDRAREAIEALTPLGGRRDFVYAAEVSTILGQCQLTLQQYEAAALRFQEVLDDQIDDDLADDAAALQAEAWHDAGQPARAADSARLLVSRWPDSPMRERAELFWGLAEMAQGNYAAAAERFGDLLERFPNGQHAEQATLLHAQSLHRANAPRRAIEAYRRVIGQAHDTYIPEALYGLSLLLYQEDQARAAGSMLDEMIERFPDADLASAARVLRGRVWFDQGDLDKARAQYGKVPRTDRDQADDAAYWNAKCDLRAGDAAGAAKRLAEAIERFPSSDLRPEMMYDHAVALTRAEQIDAAVDRLEEFRRRYPRHALAPEALHLLAATEHERGAYDRSLALCATFLTDYADHALVPAVEFMAAESTFLSGRYADAAIAYRGFLARFPNDTQAPAATYRLGMALYQLHDYEEAEPLLTRSAAKRKKGVMFRPALLAVGDLHFQAGRWSTAETYFSDYLAFGLDQPSADDALFKLGLSHHRQNETAEALAAYDRLIAEFPGAHEPQVTFERGQALVALGRSDEAKRVFHAIVRDEPGSRFAMHALNYLGTIAINEKDYTAAAALFDRVTKQKDAGADILATALAQRGAALFAAGIFDQAEAVFRRLLDRYPESPHAATATARLAIALARQDRHQDALDLIGTMSRSARTSLDPELRSSLAYEKAWCLRALGRPDDAITAYGSLVQEPGGGDLANHGLLEMAELESGAGRADRAESHLEQLLERPGLSSDLRGQAMYRLAVCAYEDGRHQDAARRFTAFIDAYPASDLIGSAHLLAGESLFKSGRHGEAARHLEQFVSGDPGSESIGPGLLRLGECHAALQNWPESERAFRRYLDRFASADLAYQARFGLGWAQENQGRRDAAVASYREVVDTHAGPTAARAQFQIGECLYADKKYDEAARELLKVDILYNYPEWSAAALYEAGRCFRELGDPVQARELFTQVAETARGTQWGALAVDRLKELSRSGLPGH